MVNSSSFEKHDITAITNVFASLRKKILWKFEATLQVPSNVMIASWLPQNEILAHRNVKLFISHGGMLSTLEALHNAVPILGIPLWGDQKRNVECGVSSGWALRLNYANLTEDSFRWTVNEMLDNPRLPPEI